MTRCNIFLIKKSFSCVSGMIIFLSVYFCKLKYKKAKTLSKTHSFLQKTSWNTSMGLIKKNTFTAVTKTWYHKYLLACGFFIYCSYCTSLDLTLSLYIHLSLSLPASLTHTHSGVILLLAQCSVRWWCARTSTHGRGLNNFLNKSQSFVSNFD